MGDCKQVVSFCSQKTEEFLPGQVYVVHYLFDQPSTDGLAFVYWDYGGPSVRMFEISVAAFLSENSKSGF